MSTATEHELSELHGQLARVMQKRLASGEATASDLSVIRQFLRDNGISCAGTMNADMAALSQTLESIPDFNPDISQ